MRQEKYNIINYIEMTQAFDKEVSDMCNLSKGIIEESLAEGRAEGRADTWLEAIRGLMESMKITAEQAMAVLKVPQDERSKYEELLKQTAPKA